MIQKDKNLEAKQNVQKIIFRAGQIKDVIKSMFEYVIFTQERYHAYCKNVFQNLISFETKISKNCRYEPDKTNMVLRLSKQYRELPGKIENYSEVNLHRLPSIIKNEQLNKYELQLKKKSQTFHNQFRNYSQTIREYNSIYQKYLNNCDELDEIIQKFKSYSDPLKFYDKSVTSEYQEKLQSHLNLSKNQETKVTTELQLLDSKRKFLDELIKEIREIFTHLFQSSLKSIQSVTALINDTGKDTNSPTQRNYQSDVPIVDANQSSKHSEAYQIQFQRLNTFTSLLDQGNQIISDFNDIMKDRKSKKYNEHIVADHKLFSLRCQNLKSKKEKAFVECLTLHQSLLELFEDQIKNYKQFEKLFRQKERKIFGINGKQSYKKQVETFFGHKAYKLHEFMFYIIELPRRAFEQINVWITDNYVNFKQVIESKKESIQKFNKFYDQIMNEHLKQKQKFQESDPNDNEVSQIYRSNLISCLDQFKFIFSELQARQSQKDKIVSEKLAFMYKFITKQYNICMIQNIVETHKDKIQLLRNFKIISEAMQVFKNDQTYNILYEEFFTANLEKSFQSKINNKQYNEAQAILRQKEKIAKKMLKRQIGCCGLIKASPIESQIFSTHLCYVYNNNSEKSYPYGKLKILKQGLIFQESKWNPFCEKVYILIPKSDVHSIQSKTLSNNQFMNQINEGVLLNTQKGPLILLSKQLDNLYGALQKIYGQNFRKSLALDRKALTRNDSTQSGGQGKGSLMVGYNKEQKTFIEQPVCINPTLSRVNLSGSMDKKLKGSTALPSGISINSDQHKVNRSRVGSKEYLREVDIINQMYSKLIKHYDKHQFLSQKFIFIDKSYKSSQRKDYEFNDKETHNHFSLKELKKHNIIDTTAGIVLQITYQWKIAYPTSSSLHSFKHGQKITVNLNLSPPTINIVEWPHVKNQIFNRHFFYENIKHMNNNIWKYIVQNTNQDFLYEPMVEKQFDQIDNSEDMFVDDIREFGAEGYPEELSIKQSKIYPITNQLKVNSGEYIDFRGSNARSIVSARSGRSNNRRSNVGQSVQGLFRGVQM